MDAKNIYSTAARLGVPFGAYLSALSAAMVFSDQSQVLPVVALAMMVCLPMALYRMQRRSHILDPVTPYAGIWLLGMVTLIFASLICAMVSYVLITTMRPDFINEQMQAAINVYSATPELRDSQLVEAMRTVQKENLLPTPIEYVIQMFWMTSFSGSMLSAFTALLAVKLPHRQRRV